MRVDLFIDDKPLVDEAMQAKIVEHVRAGEHVDYDLAIPAGCHDLRVSLTYRGSGAPPFAHLKGHEFWVTSRRSFAVGAHGEGGGVVEVNAYEQGNDDTPLESRPAVRYTEKLYAKK